MWKHQLPRDFLELCRHLIIEISIFSPDKSNRLAEALEMGYATFECKECRLLTAIGHTPFQA